MNKALIEKAFEKWAEKHKTGVESKRDEVTAKTAFIAGATWQREQLEAEILNKEKSWYAEFPDEKSAQDVFNIIKDLQTENKKLQSKLDEAVEIIEVLTKEVLASLNGEGIFYSDENNIKKLERIPLIAEQCGIDLSSLDKQKEEL